MHFAKEYISAYNNAKDLIKHRLNDVEKELDSLLAIKNIKDLNQCKFLYENNMLTTYEIIDINLKFIVDHLEELQMFCHEDIKTIIPHINSIKELSEIEAFQKAKNIDWLIETIKQETELTVNEKSNLLDISEFNKKMRYFIHSTMAFAQNPLPYAVKRKLEKNISKEELINSPLEMYEDICYCLSECYRIRKSIDQFHILSNVDYGNWKSEEATSEDIEKYLNIYKHRLEGFFYKEHLYRINVDIKNSIKSKPINLPMEKIKEVIDVIIHNAAEELVEKEIEHKSEFKKIISCEIKEVDKEVVIAIRDNGRGFDEDDNIDKAFKSTKRNFKNHGIGLDIANKNAMIMAGKINKYNNDDEGSTFEFVFPFNKIISLEGFRQKINILVIGEENRIEEEAKQQQEIYSENRIIRIKSNHVLREYIKDKLLRFINVIVKEKKNIKGTKLIKDDDFKGKIIEV